MVLVSSSTLKLVQDATESISQAFLGGVPHVRRRGAGLGQVEHRGTDEWKRYRRFRERPLIKESPRDAKER